MTYELADDPLPRPELPGTVIVARSRSETLDAVGMDLLGYSQACVRTFGDFHLALSGGSTPMPLYERLMYDPEFRAFPWRRTHLWIVDERCVPFDDERSNFGKIREVIVAHSDIPREQVHPIEATRPDADVAYEAELKETLGWREKGQDRLDVVLLGMGADGHTASLFPNTARHVLPRAESHARSGHDDVPAAERGPRRHAARVRRRQGGDGRAGRAA
jgi:6-phosphogluconolactonase